jgi:hypothetical protein
MNPKRAALAGLVFVVIAFFYVAVQAVAGVPVDFAGFTMLLALGMATSLMAYVLFAGLQQG